MISLSGRHAVITGGSRGIGYMIAARLRSLGADITLTGRHAETLDAARQKLDDNIPVYARLATAVLDVADASAIVTTFAALNERPIDILVNNAGEAQGAWIESTDLALWQRMLAVNLTGTFLCTAQVVAGMKERRFGRIVNIASTAGLIGYPFASAYCAAKHGVVGFTRAAALEFARTGITVNAVCPGYTDTDIARTAIRNVMANTGKTEAEAIAQLTARNPQKRLVTPEEVAHVVAMLCAPDAEALTGQAISVSGGEVLN